MGQPHSLADPYIQTRPAADAHHPNKALLLLYASHDVTTQPPPASSAPVSSQHIALINRESVAAVRRQYFDLRSIFADPRAHASVGYSTLARMIATTVAHQQVDFEEGAYAATRPHRTEIGHNTGKQQDVLAVRFYCL